MSTFAPWVGQRIGEFSAPRLSNLNRQQFANEHIEEMPQDTATVRQTPTPANTGAPMPGYRQRTNITPQSTGAPMPKANTPQTPPVPVKPKGKKPTAPGTKPKKN
jgi:hypothetical protein